MDGNGASIRWRARKPGREQECSSLPGRLSEELWQPQLRLPVRHRAGLLPPRRDFELFCNSTHGASQPPRLFLHDGNTEVVADIEASDGVEGHYIAVSFSQSVPVRPEEDVYIIPWNPGRSPTGYFAQLNFTGCDFDMYVLDHDTNKTVEKCTTTCPDEDITDKVASLRQDCNGTGCCSTDDISKYTTGFDIKFVRQKIGKLKFKAHSNRSSIWDTIDVSTDYASILWAITVDEPGGPFQNSTDYACLSNHSSSELQYQEEYNDVCIDQKTKSGTRYRHWD
ncbi:hypothetical protein ZWY2020_015447 [Hordeum vulgare]|nr:hypothetical protein ZWY2020_015447 [Hordeum vulgare]